MLNRITVAWRQSRALRLACYGMAIVVAVVLYATMAPWLANHMGLMELRPDGR
jgi:hypothetical protein